MQAKCKRKRSDLLVKDGVVRAEEVEILELKEKVLENYISWAKL